MSRGGGVSFTLRGVAVIGNVNFVLIAGIATRITGKEICVLQTSGPIDSGWWWTQLRLRLWLVNDLEDDPFWYRT